MLSGGSACGATSETRVVRTGDLPPGVRPMLDEAFDGRFGDDDWDHALGGWHVVVIEGGAVVSHASVVRRALHVDGQPVDTGYVEGVGTAPARQGEGLGTLVMREIDTLIRRHHDLGALATSAQGFYERLGWERWGGPTYVRRDGAPVRTPDEDGGIMVLRFGPTAGVDLGAALSCEARRGDDW